MLTARTPDRLNARKSLRKRTRQPYPHILPVLSSLHEAQSQTRRGDGDGDGDTDGGEAGLNVPARAMGAGSPLVRARLSYRLSEIREN